MFRTPAAHMLSSIRGNKTGLRLALTSATRHRLLPAQPFSSLLHPLRTFSPSSSSSSSISTSSPQQSRRALSYSSTEPEFLVEPDDAVMDPKDILVPYIVDAKRVEIYQKHKEDPVSWSVANIAQHYSMSLTRARAIVYLMQQREELMTERGVLTVPPLWQQLWDVHNEAPELPLETLAEEHEVPGGAEEAGRILAVMEDHHFRKVNLQDYNEYMDWSLDLLDLLGVNTAFTEIGQSFSRSCCHSCHCCDVR